MKTRLLIIIGISIFGLLSIDSEENNAFGFCVPSTDWPDKPCYGCPGCYPGLEKEKILWEPYYDFKGAEWMELKKQEMNLAIQNDTLDEWFKLTPNTQANLNVNNYYFLLGEAPHDGMYFDQALEQENRDKVWKIVDLGFIDFSYVNKIGVPIQVILEKTAYNNCTSFDAKITDRDGNLVWGEVAEALCDPNQNPILVTSYIKIGNSDDNPIIINESGKYYIEIETGNMFTKKVFIVTQNHGGVNPCDEGDEFVDGGCLTPIPEPVPNIHIPENCGPGTTYQDGICVVIHPENSNQTKNQNDKWTAAYQDISNDSESEPPTMSDEQQQMMWEYCETGIRHPDMMGIPQCAKNVPGCGPGPMFMDGVCSPFDLGNPSKGLVLGLILVVALGIGIAGIVVVTRMKENR